MTEEEIQRVKSDIAFLRESSKRMNIVPVSGGSEMDLEIWQLFNYFKVNVLTRIFRYEGAIENLSEKLYQYDTIENLLTAIQNKKTMMEYLNARVV